MRFTLALILAVAISGCGGTQFHSPGAAAKRDPAGSGGNDGEEVTGKSARDASVVDDADETLDDGRSKVFETTLEKKDALVDFLVVVDNSSSMLPNIAKVSQGLLNVPEASFPEGLKMAVVTTMASNPANPERTHPDIFRYIGIDLEPGFLAPVTAEQVRLFDKANPIRARAYKAFDVCEDAWFDPFQNAAGGNRCFQGALQNPFAPVGCEAGLLSLKQLLEKQGSNLVRAGANLEVLFISDEQDGCRSVDTTTGLPTAADLVDAAAKAGIANLRLNGILQAAASPYFAAIAGTGGVHVDIHSPAADYTGIMDRFVSEAKHRDLTVTLPEAADKILIVRVSGIEVEGVKLSPDATHLTLPKIENDADVKVEVTYVPRTGG